MRIRPYRSTDFPYISQWLTDERTYALWCANLLPYPLESSDLNIFIAKDEAEWGGSAYVYTEDSGRPVGFFMYSINDTDNTGFAKFIVVDHTLRGRGIGSQMIRLLLHYAFTVTGVSTVRLNVFDCNPAARRCYEKAGFQEELYMPDAFSFRDEIWGRSLMAAKRP